MTRLNKQISTIVSKAGRGHSYVPLLSRQKKQKANRPFEDYSLIQ